MLKKNLCRPYVFLVALAALHVCMPLSNAAADVVVAHSITVNIDVKGRAIRGVDRIRVKEGVRALRLYLRSGSRVENAVVAGAPVAFTVRNAGENLKEVSLVLPDRRGCSGRREVTMSFIGVFPGPDAAQKDVKRGVAHLKDGVIGDNGAILPSSSFWYPQEKEGLPVFDLTVTMPAGYASMSEGEKTASTVDEQDAEVTEVWTVDHPCDGVDLIVGRYAVESVDYKGIALYTYFYEKDDALSKTYIDKTKEYIDLYASLIGPYPFRKFAVVEGFMPTGYGMPSFTLFGSSVLRLPFIPETSLGHEIAHNWWGNSVFGDDSTGNWIEAITTFSADYLYALKKGADEGRVFRKGKLVGYRNFPSKTGTPLSGFFDATDAGERAVGYNKGLFVFEMLKREIGAEAFDKGFKGFYAANKFRRASWKDIRAAFENASGRDLGWFFDQWLLRGGGPQLTLEDAGYTASGAGPHRYSVRFRLAQKGTPYRLTIPVVVEGEDGSSFTRDIKMEGVSEEVIVSAVKPKAIEIDPGYEVFRLLSTEEMPASFASFFGARGGVVVVPEAHKDKYLDAAGIIQKDFDKKIISDTDSKALDYLKKDAIFILGGARENGLYDSAWAMMEGALKKEGIGLEHGVFTANGQSYPLQGAVAAFAVKNPADPSKTVCAVFSDAGKESLTAAVKRLKYFSDYGFIVFFKDGTIEKGRFPAKNALRREFKD